MELFESMVNETNRQDIDAFDISELILGVKIDEKQIDIIRPILWCFTKEGIGFGIWVKCMML